MLSDGCKVKLHMRGTLDDGRTFYDTHVQGGVPVEITLGQSGLLPALEEGIKAMEPGERKRVQISAEDAYGEYDATLKETLSADKIPNADKLPVGEYVVFPSPDGPLRVKVESAADGVVTFDYNHELAGHDLTFEVDLVKALAADGSVLDEELYRSEAECGCKGALGHGASHDASKGHCGCASHG